MALTALVDLLAQRIAQEINAVRAETLALVSGPAESATSTVIAVFDGGDATLSEGTPIADGGSA